MRKAALALAVSLGLAGFGIGHATAEPDTVRVRIPVCAEDEPYLRGRGDFDGIRWGRYVCIHIDRVEVSR